jgi:hypothetical protein
MSESEANRLITHLLDLRETWETRHAMPLPVMSASATPTATPGYYFHEFTVYRVQKSHSGKVYAKELRVKQEAEKKETPTRGVRIIEPAMLEYVYVPGAVYRHEPSMRMKVERMQSMGQDWGTCVVCTKHLMTEGAKDEGIHEWCEEKVRKDHE